MHMKYKGQFKIPMMVGVAGSVDPPAQVLLCCSCVGPRIELDQAEVRNSHHVRKHYS